VFVIAVVGKRQWDVDILVKQRAWGLRNDRALNPRVFAGYKDPARWKF
jgi:hypothetical protein